MNTLSTTFLEPPVIPQWISEVYPFHRRIVDLDGTPMHYVDEGEGPVVFMMHGNPTWSFLWRDVIRGVVNAGFRAIAPDMIGLGFSHKPHEIAAHTLDMHVSKLTAFADALELDGITIAGQDWGGPMVAGMAARKPERVRGAVFANTAVLGPKEPIKTTPFHRLSHMPVISELLFKGFMFPVPVMHKVQGDPKSIGRLQKYAYKYPLRHPNGKIAPLALARMVPNGPDHPTLPELRKCEEWARNFDGPAALVWGLKDPILGRALKRMRETFPQASVEETQAGHFLQEEVPDILAEAIVRVARESQE